LATQLAKGKVTRLASLRLNLHGLATDFLVTLYPDNTIGFREKGRRAGSEIFLPLSSVYQHGCMIQGQRERLADKQKKAMRTVSRGLLTTEKGGKR
jgi:hypothetical protein